MNKATHYIDGNGYVTKRRLPKFKPPTIARLKRRAKVVLKGCGSCGKQAESKGPTWCDCNPGAPFKMVPVWISERVDQLIGRAKA